MTDKIGEELTVEQLEPKTVYLLRASHRPDLFITAWFLKVEGRWARFHMGETRTAFVVGIRNGKLFDDVNHQIHVYRYKGEI